MPINHFPSCPVSICLDRMKKDTEKQQIPTIISPNESITIIPFGSSAFSYLRASGADAHGHFNPSPLCSACQRPSQAEQGRKGTAVIMRRRIKSRGCGDGSDGANRSKLFSGLKWSVLFLERWLQWTIVNIKWGKWQSEDFSSFQLASNSAEQNGAVLRIIRTKTTTGTEESTTPEERGLDLNTDL